MKRLFIAVMLLAAFSTQVQAEKRDEWFRTRISSYGEFYERYNPLYRIGALANYWNLNVYDSVREHPEPAYIDGSYYQDLQSKALGNRIRLETDLETAAPYFSRLAWGVGQSFMWTHSLHENIFDILADPALTMEQRHRMIESVTDEYLKNPRALSPVAIPMESMHALPYHGAFHREYPKMTGLMWAGHWFHGGVYEAQIEVVHGRKTREQAITETEAEFERLVQNPPSEHPHFQMVAQNFTRMHPRAANIFGNMHMLHDMVADIMADDSITDKRKVIYEARDMMLASRARPSGEGEAPHVH